MGYTQLQLDFWGDMYLEVARAAGVLSVLGSVSMSVWVTFLNCISLGRFQIRLMSICMIALIAFNGATFAFFRSKLCNDLTSYQDSSYKTECTLDQGGLVICASAMLWCVALLVTCVYIKSPDMDVEIGEDGKITNKFEERKEKRKTKKMNKQQKKKEARLKQVLAEQKAAQDRIRKKHNVGSKV